MRLDRYAFWWYVLPIALGCMIPPVLLFAMDFSKVDAWGRILLLLSMLGIFAAVFAFVHVVMRYGTRM
jgi:membrane-anchored protein YejM (alkaline phosphatase superfamily)